MVHTNGDSSDNSGTQADRNTGDRLNGTGANVVAKQLPKRLPGHQSSRADHADHDRQSSALG